jgi:diguanylate cyclase (GGDEF)-like protein
MRHFIDSTDQYFQRQRPAWVILVSILLAILLGILDYWSGFEISFSFFYLVPISITIWYIGLRSGILISVICIIIWTLTNWLAGETYSHEIIRYWNAFFRLSLFLSISYLLYKLKLALVHERSLSRTDFVTGIFNAREFYRLAELEMLRSRRFNHPLTIAFIDLDDFKYINDQLGHSVGDGLLKAVAKAISSTLRRTDFVARLGGDEFAILLPQTDASSARLVTEKIKICLTDKIEPDFPPVTMSIGVVTCSFSTESIDELLKRADLLMYQAKNMGKNQALFDELKL